MSASVGFTGKGGVVSVSTTLAGTYTTIGQVKDVKHSGMSSTLIDITNLSSPSNYKEQIPGLLSAGKYQLDIIADPQDAGQTMLLASFNAQTLLYLKVQWPLVGTQTTSGNLDTSTVYVTSAPRPSFSLTQAATFSAELTITGPITSVAGS